MITCPSCHSTDRAKRKMTPHDPDGYLRLRGCAVPIVPCKDLWHNSPPPAFDAAIADVEIDYEISGGGEHTIAYITGLDDVVAAHNAEIIAAVNLLRETLPMVTLDYAEDTPFGAMRRDLLARMKAFLENHA